MYMWTDIYNSCGVEMSRFALTGIARDGSGYPCRVNRVKGKGYVAIKTQVENAFMEGCAWEKDLKYITESEFRKLAGIEKRKGSLRETLDKKSKAKAQKSNSQKTSEGNEESQKAQDSSQSKAGGQAQTKETDGSNAESTERPKLPTKVTRTGKARQNTASQS